MNLTTELYYNGIPAFNNITNGDQIGAFAGIPTSLIGIQQFTETPVAIGTKYASPTGAGSAYTFANPGSIQATIAAAVPGDVIFLRGGTYNLTSSLNITNSGTQDKRITIESYPGETAIIDASAQPRVTPGVTINLSANYITFRNIEITGMVEQGMYISGSFNIIEYCVIHDNSLSGLMVFNDYTNPRATQYNIIRNNTFYANSDAALSGGEYNLGGNADGISISCGFGTIVEHNVVFNNSDDGIDVWRAVNSIVRYNIVYGNGSGPNGNGNGIKSGGPAPGDNNLIAHNLVFNNKEVGITWNECTNVKMFFNTSYNNGASNYDVNTDTVLEGNVSMGGSLTYFSGSPFEKNNSWNRSDIFVPKSTTYGTADFLHLREIKSQADEKVSRWQGVGNTTTISAIGDSALTLVGNATAHNVAADTVYNALSGTEIIAASASAGVIAGGYLTNKKWFRGSRTVQGSGGFDFMCQFGISGSVSGIRFFVGLTGSVSAPTDVNPSTLINVVGFGCDSSDSEGIIFRNDGSGTATKINLGADMSMPATDRVGCFEVRLFCEPMSGVVYYVVKNLVNGVVANGALSDNLPLSDTLLAPRIFITSGSNAKQVGVKLGDMWVKRRM